MNKIAIIGLGLIGNSMGMGLKRAFAGSQQYQVVGIDPDRSLEEAALRKFFSVDSIAPDLERAVQGAQLVIVATPPTAVREVLGAIGPFLDEGTTVTDTLSVKEPVIAWAGELLRPGVSFVGGHPMSHTVDLETAEMESPSADLFLKAPYCIIPSPNASGEALNLVIGVAESVGAKPLFIDAYEHDSFFAAASHLPVLVSAALLRVTSGSPSWDDIGSFAREQFGEVAGPLSADPARLRDSLVANRQSILHWIDQYMLTLHDFREMLAGGDDEALLAALQQAQDARHEWVAPGDPETTGPFAARQSAQNAQLRANLQQAISDTNPLSTSRFFGKYLSDRMFGRKEK